MEYTVITGASSGIGRELAFTYANKGHNLILVSRRLNILEDIKNHLERDYSVSVKCFECDLNDLDHTLSVFTNINEHYPINCIINNAGTAFFAPVKEVKLNRLQLEINVNITAPILICKLLLENIKKHNGSIINIASILSFFPNVNASVYVATKHALLGFSNSLRIEEPTIHIMTVHPSTVSTNFFKDPSYLQQKKNVLTPKLVAKRIYTYYKKRKRVLHVPRKISLIKGIYLFFPTFIDFLNKKFYSKK